MTAIRHILYSRYALWLLLGLPLVVIAARYATGSLFYGEVVHLTGELSIRLMMLAMAATPLMLMLPGRALPRWLMKNRRYIGVASFAYAVLHTWVYLDRTGVIADILDDALLMEYLTGWIGLLLFAALAATSNDFAVRLMKRSWKLLHRSVYLAAVLSFVHWVLVAFDPLPAWLHIAVLSALEAYRLWKLRQVRAAAA